MYFISAIDEYNCAYDAWASDDRSEAEWELNSLYDALEDATGDRAYLIRCAISELEDQLKD